jgi:Meiotically Up-regulated Gene 113 (MUG113) protein
MQEGCKRARMFIYVIRCQNLRKVGVAINIKTRMSNIAVHNPFELELEKSVKCDPELILYAEAGAHALLEKHHVRGEWFNSSAKQTADAVDRAIRWATDPIMKTRLFEGRLRPIEQKWDRLRLDKHWLGGNGPVARKKSQRWRPEMEDQIRPLWHDARVHTKSIVAQFDYSSRLLYKKLGPRSGVSE